MKTVRNDDLQRATDAEASWETYDDDENDDKSDEFIREKHLSKTKKMKNYLKKCKTTAENFIQQRYEQSAQIVDVPQLILRPRKATENSVPLTSWYVTDEFCTDEETESHVTVVQMTDAARNTIQNVEYDTIGAASIQSANVEMNSEIVILDNDRCSRVRVEEIVDTTVDICSSDEDTYLLESFMDQSFNVDADLFGQSALVCLPIFYEILTIEVVYNYYPLWTTRMSISYARAFNIISFKMYIMVF